jgi:predicted ATPase
VNFLVGENGSGKSTLVEGIAVAVGLNPEGGSKSHRFRPHGLYLLDEPEAALSARGCMAAIVAIQDLVDQGAQFLIATHSPILLAVPNARIMEIADDGTVDPVPYDDALPVRATRRFLADPTAAVRALLS